MEDVAPPGARAGVEGPAAVAVAQAAPVAATHLAAVRAMVADGSDRDVVALASARIAQLLGAGGPDRTGWAASVAGPERVAALAGWPGDPAFHDRDRACLAFTEQFVLDVASVDEAQRGALAGALGPAGAGAFTVALFVVDMGTRLDLALDRLVGDAGLVRDGGEADATAGGPAAAPARVPDPVPEGTGGTDDAAGGGLYGELDRFWRDVARLDRIDPVTTELVRLRSARHHNCRLCRSTRSLAALQAGVAADVLDRAEAGEPVDLGAAQRAALDVVDAVVTQPGAMTADLVARARAGWSTAQLVELVLDVVRNSGQKIAVALGADDPHVASGTELFTVGADGVVTFLGEAPVP